MKLRQKQKPLRFGDWVTLVYDVCGDRKASAVVRRAVNAHVVTFRGQQRFVIN